MANCATCKAEIFWRISAKSGNYMPLDAEPAEDGNIILIDSKAHVLVGDLFESMHEGPRYKSHFSTCPDAKKHRKENKDG